MSAAFFNGFDALIIDADGVPSRLESETFNVVKLPSMTSLGIVTSDEFGHIASHSLPTIAGVVVQFSHPDYPNTFNRTIAVTPAAAADLLENMQPAFVAEDLSTGEVPVSMEIWAHDLDNNTEDQLLGYAAIGGPTNFPFESAVGRNLRFFANPVYAGGGRKFALHEDASFLDSAASAGGPPPDSFITKAVFAFTEDVDSISGGADMYVGIIPGNVFSEDLAGIRGTYSGIYGTNAHSKEIALYFDTNNIFSYATTQNGGAWQLDFHIIRYSSSILKSIVRLTFQDFVYPAVDIEFDALDPLDLTIPYALRLVGDCDVSDDFQARTGYAERIAAPEADSFVYVLDDDGAFVVDDDDSYVLSE